MDVFDLWSPCLDRCAMPFDWAFSSPAMVCDCLADDFKSFLDPREYVAIGRRGQVLDCLVFFVHLQVLLRNEFLS